MAKGRTYKTRGGAERFLFSNLLETKYEIVLKGNRYGFRRKK